MTNPLTRITAALSARYRVERQLGAGGMASVYLAHNLKHGREVAMKVLHGELTTTVGVERFLREISIVARLQHPNILTLIDSGEVTDAASGERFVYYVMPRANGESLLYLLARRGALPVADVLRLLRLLRLLRDIVDGVASAHRHGIIHRDLKPENIPLAEHHAMVVDFGVAKAVSDARESARLTATGTSCAVLFPGVEMRPRRAPPDRGKTVSAILRLIHAGDNDSAFTIAARAPRSPKDSLITSLWPRFTRTLTFVTTPAGATISRALFEDTTLRDSSESDRSRERISFDAAYGGRRMLLTLYLPRRADPRRTVERQAGQLHPVARPCRDVGQGYAACDRRSGHASGSGLDPPRVLRAEFRRGDAGDRAALQGRNAAGGRTGHGSAATGSGSIQLPPPHHDAGVDAEWKERPHFPAGIVAATVPCAPWHCGRSQAAFHL
ncbi:MAG: serine/threonine protein kinase [Gemmatimonadaceae bacterium]|nr:serine/threonine protein kinase [Gemmatimonadaceae bacterium]